MSAYVDYLNGDTLQHHGVLGMKWGIRRYQPYPKGSRAGREIGEAARVKRYKKELKKLNKYKDRANVDLQRANAEKYAAKAKKAGKVAAVSGSIALATSHPGIQRMLDNRWDKNAKEYKDRKEELWDEYHSLSDSKFKDGHVVGFKEWLKADRRQNEILNVDFKENRRRLDRRQDFVTGLEITKKAVTIGAAATSAIAGGAFGYYKVKELAARHRTTEAGHAKAQEKVQRQTEKMLEMFGDFKVSELKKEISK